MSLLYCFRSSKLFSRDHADLLLSSSILCIIYVKLQENHTYQIKVTSAVRMNRSSFSRPNEGKSISYLDLRVFARPLSDKGLVEKCLWRSSEGDR